MRRSASDKTRKLVPRSASTGGRASRNPGHLLMVTCADPGRLDLLLRAAMRHLGSACSATLVEPITTRMRPAGGGIVLKQSAIGELERAGALTLMWSEGQHRSGYPASLLARLAMGENAITSGPQEMELKARQVWPHLSVIRVGVGTEALREGLSPRATFSRSANGAGMGRALRPLRGDTYDVRVEDCADVGLALRRLAAAIHCRLSMAEAMPAPSVEAPPRKTVRGRGKLPAASIGDVRQGGLGGRDPLEGGAPGLRPRSLSPN